MIIREIVVWLWGRPEDKDLQRSRLYYRWKDFRITGNHLFWAYCLVGLFTFGYSATTYPLRADPEHYYTETEALGGTAMKGTVAAVCWPAYWVWEIMDDGTATR